MKQFIAALILLVLVGCNKQGVLITIELPDQPDVNVGYSVPISGTIFYYFNDTLKANETGKFELNLNITQPSFILIHDENFQNRVKFLIEQGNNYHVVMGPEKNIQITGANEKGQMLYTSLPDPDYIELELRKIVNYWDDNIVDSTSLLFIHQKCNELKQADLLKFKELLDNKEITQSFFDLIQKDRDCYYASMEARFSTIKATRQFNNEIKVEDELLENLKKIYAQYPPNDESLLFSSFWPEYAGGYITIYNQFIQEDYNYQKVVELRNEKLYNTHIINESKKYLSGKALGFFQARYIYFECRINGSRKGDFKKEFISLFEQFEKDYPQNEYSKYIKPYINEIISHFEIIEQPFDPGVLFVDNYETFNTLEEAVKPLRGKKIYIDVWATWCGPCKEEFAHNEALKKLLAENDIQLLYISMDEDVRDQDWKNDIKHHHLNGLHIRANKELNDNLIKQHNIVSIPWYILIDEKGNIMEECAKRPSELAMGATLFTND